MPMMSDDSSRLPSVHSAVDVPDPPLMDQEESEEKLQSDDDLFDELESLTTPETGKS